MNPMKFFKEPYCTRQLVSMLIFTMGITGCENSTKHIQENNLNTDAAIIDEKSKTTLDHFFNGSSVQVISKSDILMSLSTLAINSGSKKIFNYLNVQCSENLCEITRKD